MATSNRLLGEKIPKFIEDKEHTNQIWRREIRIEGDSEKLNPLSLSRKKKAYKDVFKGFLLFKLVNIQGQKGAI